LQRIFHHGEENPREVWYEYNATLRSEAEAAKGLFSCSRCDFHLLIVPYEAKKIKACIETKDYYSNLPLNLSVFN